MAGPKTITGNTNPAPVPHVSRWAERDARRQENARLAEEAAHRRSLRNSRRSVKERVEAAQKKLDGANTAGAVELINTASDAERDFLIIGEKYGQARKGVLRNIGAPRASVERQYLDEAGLSNPDESPETGTEE